MTMRHWLENVIKETKRPGQIRAGEFAEINHEELIEELRAQPLMSKPIADCSDGQCESAHAIIVICTLFQGGQSRAEAQLCALRLVDRLEEVSRRDVAAHTSGFFQKIGVNLGDMFGQRLRKAS